MHWYVFTSLQLALYIYPLRGSTSTERTCYSAAVAQNKQTCIQHILKVTELGSMLCVSDDHTHRESE